MKSFTASTALGDVRVRLPDDGPPFAILNGTVLAAGIPTVVAPDAVVDGALVCFPNGQWYGRKATAATRTAWDGSPVDLADVDVAQTGACLIVADMGSLWGVRPDRRGSQFTGFTFADGAARVETWTVDMPPLPRACCGRKVPDTPVVIPLAALAIPLA